MNVTTITLNKKEKEVLGSAIFQQLKSLRLKLHNDEWYCGKGNRKSALDDEIVIELKNDIEALKQIENKLK